MDPTQSTNRATRSRSVSPGQRVSLGQKLLTFPQPFTITRPKLLLYNPLSSKFLSSVRGIPS